MTINLRPTACHRLQNGEDGTEEWLSLGPGCSLTAPAAPRACRTAATGHGKHGKNPIAVKVNPFVNEPRSPRSQAPGATRLPGAALTPAHSHRGGKPRAQSIPPGAARPARPGPGSTYPAGPGAAGALPLGALGARLLRAARPGLGHVLP